MNDENSQVWCITGCSSGLGRALAEAALAKGHRVIASARDLRSLCDLESPGRCHIATLDVTEFDTIPAFIKEAQAQWGRIDVLVNNAGYGLIAAVEESEAEQIKRSFDTHFFGPLRLIQACLPMMRQQGSGHLVNISAAAAISNYAGFGIYGAAKAALEAMSESLKLEAAAFGVKVSLIQPGPFRTDFIAKGLESASSPLPCYEGSARRFERYLRSIDGKQPGDPTKAAAALIDLVSSGMAPFRLPLGAYVVKKSRDKAAALAKAADEWQSLAASCDQ